MCNVGDIGVQKCLLVESSLTLEKVLRITLAAEETTKDASDLRGPSEDPGSRVNTVEPKLHGRRYDEKKTTRKEGQQE